MWMEELKKAIEAEAYYEVQGLAWMNPVEFFNCFNVRNCRILGKNRLQWLRTTAKARKDQKPTSDFSDFDSLLLRAVEKGLGISSD